MTKLRIFRLWIADFRTRGERAAFNNSAIINPQSAIKRWVLK